MKLSRRQFLQGAATALTVPAAVDAAWSAPVGRSPAWLNEAPLRVRAGGLSLYQRRLLVVETVLEVGGSGMLRQRVKPGCTMRVALRHPGEAWCSEGVEHFELRRESRVNILHFQQLAETWP